ncbi:MAG: uracil phosphoribosyltransferase [Spirochaetales bacterium]|uniref:Uracil phosphoribosyltransferase n=1 Tax=Candidatus Thalassospirochaeta sargassi TaxID=3119039 RepID=A0AAJ1IA95_9SPIO|nr:uracil phosphoribosyltransferase [Spirochaetales bacterium]
MSKVILKATDLDGYLTDADKENISKMMAYYDQAMEHFNVISSSNFTDKSEASKKELINIYNKMGVLMQEITEELPAINVYSFKTPRESHGEASRLIAKLRDVRTENHEFLYYIQRAYEMLFNLAYGGASSDKNYLITKTPVNVPVQNYAVHKIPDVDEKIENSVMCVMLRGALLPSMIMSKEIQEYSSKGYETPFALFKINRDDSKKEKDMEYILDLEKSYFDLESLNGKDLIFADPMNATGGSLVTIVKYLLDNGVKPKSISFFNVISALKGSMRIVRALENVKVYTLWMDPVLNDKAYIMPGLGDAGDRLNGKDSEEYPRNIIQLIADYGAGISQLYRSQVRKIEETVLGE